MKTNTLIVLLLLLPSLLLKAQNPVVQTCYTSDPAPMVYGDTFWLYTGHDVAEGTTKYCMHDWHVYSSTDMVNWTDHGPRLSILDFDWMESGAWASQCIERNGKFYWYVCGRDKETRTKALGVAVGDSPVGPFRDALGKKLAGGSNRDIDPTVWIDDDGRAYLYWGNRALFYAELNSDLLSLKGDTLYKVPLEEKSFGRVDKSKGIRNFEEGPWLMKRNGKYYLLYAAGGVPEHLAYSMSDSPEGPWEYKGELMSLYDSGSATNHCGVVEYKGHHYLVYHTGKLPGGGSVNRSVAIEEFQWNDDGTLPVVKPTDKGVDPVGTLNPYHRVEAETIAHAGGVTTEPNGKSGVYVSQIHHGDSISVRVVDFGDKAPRKMIVSAASALYGGTMEVRLDAPNGPLLCAIDVRGTGGWEAWKRFEAPINKGVTGVHDLYFKFKGMRGISLFNYDWWKLVK